MTKIFFRRLASQVLLCCLIVLSSTVALAEVAGIVEERLGYSQEWTASINQWEVVFEQTNDYLTENVLNEEISEELYGKLNQIRSDALALKTKVLTQQQAVSNLLAAVGSKPTEDEPTESPTIAAKRTEYTEQLSAYREQLAQIDLAVVRTSELSAGLSSLRSGVLVKEIFTRYPSPIDPKTLYTALNEFITHIQTLVLAPGIWFASLSIEQRDRLANWPTVLIMVCSLLLSLFLRAWIIRTYGRDVRNETPSQTLKLSAAIAEGVARGLVPLLTFIGVALWVAQHATPPEGLFADMVTAGFRGCIDFVVLSSLLNVILSPAYPSWRLINMTPASTRVIGSAALLLLIVVTLDRFIVGSVGSIELSEQVESVYIGLVTMLKAGLILVISIGRWWENTGENALDEEDDSEQDDTSSSYLDYIRRIVVLFCVVAILATLLGYSKFSVFLIDNLINSALIVFLFYGLRAILVEIATAFTSSKVGRLRLGLRMQTLLRIRLWLSGIISVVLFVTAAAAIAIIWGVAAEDIYRWLVYLFTGFTVGSITISLTEILEAVLVFVSVMIITRLLQRALMSSVLPQFTSNQSVQHSLSSGAGYVGIAIACTMFIAALGIKLENIALVAGALSVGIGFGLQNIVGNVVSGLILILERPIKVGDWVSVGGNEGFVQQIKFRATELETFTSSTVIIPNSEMLSNPLTNMTYHDKTSRVEILLQVAYGSDPQQVIKILEDAANQQTEVLRFPEVYVLLADFAADGLNFELRCFVRDATMKLSVSSKIRLKVLEALTDAGIEIPFPQRVMHMAESTPPVGNDLTPKPAS